MTGGRSYRDYTVFDVHGKSWKFVVWASHQPRIGSRHDFHGMVFGMVPVGSFLSPWLFLSVC